MNDKEKNKDQLSTKVQYGVGAVPYHTHNGIDSPKLAIGSANASGPGSSTTIAANDVDTKINIASADFANGITYDAANHQFTVTTAGQYLITASVFYNNPTTANVDYRCIVYLNGGAGFTGIIVPPAANVTVIATATKVVNLASGATVALYGSTHSASTQTATAASYLSIAKV